MAIKLILFLEKAVDETTDRADSWLHSSAGYNIRDVKFSRPVTCEMTKLQ